MNMNEEMPVYNVDYARKHISLCSLRSKNIDYEAVRKLASFGLNQKQIASVLKMNLSTFNAEIKKDEKLKDAIESGKTELELTISMGQLRIGLPDPENGYAGNAAMMKHLGEVHLGQSEKISVDAHHDIEIQLKFGNPKIAEKTEEENEEDESNS